MRRRTGPACWPGGAECRLAGRGIAADWNLRRGLHQEPAAGAQAIRVTVGNVIYDLARLGAGLGGTGRAPQVGLRMWALTRSRVATYAGQRGTLVGPWT